MNPYESPLHYAVTRLEPLIRAECLVSLDTLLSDSANPALARQRFKDTVDRLYGGATAFRDADGRRTRETEIFEAAREVADSHAPFDRVAVQKQLERRAAATGGDDVPPGLLDHLIGQARRYAGGQTQPFELCAGAYNHVAIARSLATNGVALTGGQVNADVLLNVVRTHDAYVQSNQLLDWHEQAIEDFRNGTHPDSAKLHAQLAKARKPILDRIGLSAGAGAVSSILMWMVAGATTATLGLAAGSALAAGAIVGAVLLAKRTYQSREATKTQRKIISDRQAESQELNAQVQQAGHDAQTAGRIAQAARQRLYQPIPGQGR